MNREKKTVAAMIGIYCRGVHGTPRGLCVECDQLELYTTQRLERCPFQEAKPTCAQCAIHCYKPHRREQIKDVMRFAGPRMLFRHPALALFHILDGRFPAEHEGWPPAEHGHRPPEEHGDRPPEERGDGQSEETHSQVHARAKESES